MRSAIVVYRSHSGVTRRYGEAIAAFLATRGLAAQVVSVGECDTSALAHADYVLLGCWTSGLFVVRQRPDEPWLAFVRDIPDLPANSGPLPKVALFTTYKLRTGSQFPKMRAALAGKTASYAVEIQEVRERVLVNGNLDPGWPVNGCGNFSAVGSGPAACSCSALAAAARKVPRRRPAWAERRRERGSAGTLG